MSIQDLFGFRGRVGRSTYFFAVIGAALLVHNIFRLLASSIDPRRLGGWNYLNFIGLLHGPQAFPAQLQQSAPLFILIAVPFLLVLINLTIKRLRDLDTIEWYAVLLFVPAVNILFFVLLCLQPGTDAEDEARRTRSSFLDTVMPRSSWGSAAAGTITGAIVAISITWFAVGMVGGYGSTLFLGLPFFMGYIAAWVYGYREPRSAGDCCIVAMASIFLTGVFLVGIAFEGIICVAMATPLAIPLALLGGYLAHLSQRACMVQLQPTSMMSLFLVLPILATSEFSTPAAAPLEVVQSSIEIAAPPQLVWRRLINFPSIPDEPHWLLRLGMAYPVEARTIGSGLSAQRQTIFSTGISQEPIVAWEEGKHLAFRVASEPPLMKESSPYGRIQVRHLEDHDFRPGQVDFYLTQLPNGHTKLDCSSSYANRMWPSRYWSIWTNAIVRQIQFRVVRHIQHLAEKDVSDWNASPEWPGTVSGLGTASIWLGRGEERQKPRGWQTQRSQHRPFEKRTAWLADEPQQDAPSIHSLTCRQSYRHIVVAQHTLVIPLVHRDHVICAEFFARVHPGLLAHLASTIRA
jgi:uncharacterized membrane protein YhaH (DUF805 family)